MIIGIAAIIFAILANIFSFINYYIIYKKTQISKKKPDDGYINNKKSLARLGFWIMSILLLIASVYFGYLLLTHQFQVKYIYQYTSKDLPLFYILSAFWAGQEGSFLLWTLLISLFGIIFIKTSKEFEVPSMLFLNVIMFFFLIILIKASPFEIMKTRPLDGSGLNPLLQNPWMAIHPPVLFAGYAAITFPFVLTLGSLLINRFKDSTDQIRFWTLVSFVTLGAGIIIGGYWAYGVLGWGGYWGWDPVENASLIPWIIIIALLHGLIIQRRKNKLYKTNTIFVLLSFILVLYATFLTRSGILADFSVHSFIDLGVNSYLIAFIIFTIIISFIVFKNRYNSLEPEQEKHLNKGRLKDSSSSEQGKIKNTNNHNQADTGILGLNRENILLYSIYVLIAVSILIFIGTSFPIISGIFSDPAQVDTSFYNRVNLPLAIFIGIFLGIIPYILWKPGKLKIDNKNLLFISIGLAFIASIIGYIFGIEKTGHIIFLFAFCFAFSSNTMILLKKGLKQWRNIGVHVSHMGTGLMFIGIIVSGVLSIDQKILLNQNEPASAIGYDIIYKNKKAKPDGKDILNIELKKNHSSLLTQPKYYFNKKMNQWIREPFIYSGLLNDIYISPLSEWDPSGMEESAYNGRSIVLKKGETKRVDDYIIHFKAFDLATHAETNAFHVGAILDIIKNDRKKEIIPSLILNGNNRISKPVLLPDEITGHGDSLIVHLYQINADDKSIQLLISDVDHRQQRTEKFLIQISKKPMMNILWLGSFLIILGSIIALYKRK